MGSTVEEDMEEEGEYKECSKSSLCKGFFLGL